MKFLKKNRIIKINLRKKILILMSQNSLNDVVVVLVEVVVDVVVVDVVV